MNNDLPGPECPQCFATDILVERRLNGNAICNRCNWRGPYKECYKKTFNEIEDRERKLFEFHGLGPLDVQAGCFAWKAFMEKDNRRGEKKFWNSPLGKQSFVIGWFIGISEQNAKR